MHRNILLRVGYLLQRAATHLLRIFKGTFFTIEKDTTKSLGYVIARGDQCEWWNKMAANFENLKKSSKNRFFSESNVFSRNVIALCADSDEKIKKNLLWPFKI